MGFIVRLAMSQVPYLNFDNDNSRVLRAGNMC